MTGSQIVKNALAQYNENELILAGKLYKEKLAEKITEQAYYKVLQRMCDSNRLIKIAKGTYHLPKLGEYGIIPPSEESIVSVFTKNETGMVIGYSLYNSLNLTTQISKTVNVFSSSVEGFTKSIRNIVIEQVPLVFTPCVKQTLEGLEILQNFNSIQDMNYPAFINYSKRLANTFNGDAFDKVLSVKSYKKSTVSFFKSVLDFYNINNNLGCYLSALSEYNHPKMEELYAFARTQNRV